MHTKQLVGLDSVKAIRDYFEQRKIELSDFEPDQTLAKDADGAAGVRAPKLMRRGHDEFLIYHPNAAADDRNTRADESKTSGVVLDLSAASGQFSVARAGLRRAAAAERLNCFRKQLPDVFPSSLRA